MNDRFESDDGEQSRGYGSCCNGAKDDETEQAPGVAARLALEEEICARDWRRSVGGGHVERIVEKECTLNVLLPLDPDRFQCIRQLLRSSVDNTWRCCLARSRDHRSLNPIAREMSLLSFLHHRHQH